MRQRFSKAFIVLALCLSFFFTNHSVSHAQYGSGASIPGQTYGQWNFGQNSSNPVWASAPAPQADPNSKDRGWDVAGQVVDWILQMWLKGITAALYVMGASFDFVTKFALDGIGADKDAGLQRTIATLWTFVRDISNIVIVFSLLYLAIRTIIEGEGFADKSKLASILVAALLINFSLLFTQLAFNVSNYVARAIRTEISVTSTDSGAPGSGGIADIGLDKNSLSGGIARLLGVPAGLNYISDSSLYHGGVQTEGNLINKENYNDDYSQIQAQYLLMLTISVMGVGFILVAGAGILLYRYIVFIFLMILAPFGLVCFFIPYLKNIGDKWLSNLKNLTIIAPVYFLSFYICMQLLNGIIALGNQQTGSVHAFLVQMFTQTALIVGTLLGTVMFPIMAANAGSGALGKVGGWASAKIRGLPKFTAQAAARGAMSGTARTSRYLFGNQLARTVGGRNEGAVKALQQRAQSGDRVARMRLAASEGLKSKTYDLRNVKGARGLIKTTTGLEVGEGIKTWDTKVAERKKKQDERLETQRQRDMKTYGYDNMAKSQDNQNEVIRLTALRDNHKADLTLADKEYKNAIKTNTQGMSQAQKQAHEMLIQQKRDILKAAQEAMTQYERDLGRQKNIGLVKQFEQMQGRLKNNLTPTRRAALDRASKELEKKFKEDGKSKKKK